MDKRTQKAYDYVFDYINEKVFDLSGTKIFITDYEQASRNALRTKYPLAKLTACHFHFAQAIRKKGSQIKPFIDFVRTDKAAEKIYYKLMYLPLLPARFIEPMFNQLKDESEKIEKEIFKKFIEYYHTQWIKKEGPERISVFGNETKTTSPAEGYNRALNDFCQKKGSFVWFCCSIRNQEFMKNKEFAAYVESGGLTGSHREKDDVVNFIQEFFGVFFKIIFFIF